jgi:hypothetical protein
MNTQFQKTSSIIESHLQNFFAGRELAFDRWINGPPETVQLLSHLHIVKVIPKPSEGEEWAYVSIGAWEFTLHRKEPLEFVLLAPFDTPRAIELLTMVVNYHRTEHLGFGHVFSIGEGWLEDSECDHFLVSLPYPFGPEFEICHIAEDVHIRFAWLLPITKAEKDFAVSRSQEELEGKFEEAEIQYSDPKRKSVI